MQPFRALSSPSGPIVVVGAHAQGLLLRVDAIPREGESVLGFGFDEPVDGGKASNQAVAAARLGAPVALVSVVGSDERGRRATAYFAGQGIDTTWVVAAEGPTDVGFILLPLSAVPAIATATERSLELNAAFVERAADVIGRASVVVSQLEAPVEAALAAFRIAHASNALTILNPSPVADLGAELLPLTDLLVPNEHEAAALAGRDGTPSELADDLAHALPVGGVVVTAGEAGAYLAAGGSVVHVAAPACEAVDTTGAGDAFLGALAVRLRVGDTLAEAVSFAVDAASLSVMRPGTMPAFATAEEVAALLARDR
jgi:ribokinase